MSLDLSAADLDQLIRGIGDETIRFVDDLPTAPTTMAARHGLDGDGRDQLLDQLVGSVSGPPPEHAGDTHELILRLGAAARLAEEMSGSRYFKFIAPGASVVAAAGDYLARVWNRNGGMAAHAPALAAAEYSVIQWMTGVLGLPEHAGGAWTVGGSEACLSAVATARERRLGDLDGDLRPARLYISEHTHHAVKGAAKIAGLPASAIRVVPTVDGRHLVADDVRRAVLEDLADTEHRRRPFLIVATAGTTATGDVDDLAGLADVADEFGLWLHVDAAVGGAFALTERGRNRLAGIERAHSVSVDAHKGLGAAFGAGMLLVRDIADLSAAHTVPIPEYLLGGTDTTVTNLPNPADLNIHLSRSFSLGAWLALHRHGLATIRQVLDTRLDYARHIHEALRGLPQIEAPVAPELNIVVFGLRGGDSAANRALIDRINASGRIAVSTAAVRGWPLLVRLCVLSHRMTPTDVDEALDVISAAAGAAAPMRRAASLRRAPATPRTATARDRVISVPSDRVLSLSPVANGITGLADKSALPRR